MSPGLLIVAQNTIKNSRVNVQERRRTREIIAKLERVANIIQRPHLPRKIAGGSKLGGIVAVIGDVERVLVALVHGAKIKFVRAARDWNEFPVLA